jgi:hypothetical protein
MKHTVSIPNTQRTLSITATQEEFLILAEALRLLADDGFLFMGRCSLLDQFHKALNEARK